MSEDKKNKLKWFHNGLIENDDEVADYVGKLGAWTGAALGGIAGLSSAGFGGAIVGSTIGAILGCCLLYPILRFYYYVFVLGAIALVIGGIVFVIKSLWGVGISHE